MGLRFSLDNFSVFNRWGERVFFTTQKDNWWNGKIKGIEQKTEIFVWYLNAKDRNNKPIQMKGTVVLIR